MNELLFFEVFKATLENLQQAFVEFKQSTNFKILKEYIYRQEKLYEVMIEGGLINY